MPVEDKSSHTLRSCAGARIARVQSLSILSRGRASFFAPRPPARRELNRRPDAQGQRRRVLM
eukprot:554670-Prymnesium_polylepis.1